MHTIKEHNRERGDTLIEVLVAVSVFGVVVVGAFALMNKGVTQMYDSMEKSQVRMLLNGQVEALTYARDQYMRAQTTALTTDTDKRAKNTWEGIKGALDTPTTPPALANCSPSDSAFSIVMSDTGMSRSTSIQAAVAEDFPSPGKGIWIEEIPSNGAITPSFIDFYVKACWLQNSSSQTQVLSTVVRLYDN